jgi:hypothetical protein
VFVSEAQDARFWTFDRADRGIFELFARLVDGLAPWSWSFVWPRGGEWQGDDVPRDRLESLRISAAIGPLVPPGYRGAIQYHESERSFFISRLVRRARVAWNTFDDLFVIPDHGQCMLGLDHHGVMHVDCADGRRMQAFIEHMVAGGYRLPDDVPDWTFKKPDWMK